MIYAIESQTAALNGIATCLLLINRLAYLIVYYYLKLYFAIRECLF